MPPLHCSLDETLGDYYQDFAPAIALVESGYHGDRDDAGVPLARHGAHGSVHNAVLVAQYALANLIALGRGDRDRAAIARVQLDWLAQAQQTGGTLAGCWVMAHDNPKYPWLRAPWTSALASGNAISALLRGWQRFGVERYRAAAEAAYAALHHPLTGLAVSSQDGSELWYEEYPSDPPLHVLNGHVYALLGVLDHARVTGDAEAEGRWRRACATVLGHLDAFDLGFWSAYDLRWREPVSGHYQKNIHVPQLRILAAVTGEARFADVADRWQRQYESAACRLRWRAALRTHGWRRRLSRPAREPASAVALRPFPYPFRAALSLCNDADLLTPQSFRRLHRFLSTTEDTEWGPGLGLHVGGSFFMFRSPDSPNRLTVFDGLADTITDDGEFILECARRGVLDVLHTYGCFTDASHFSRRLAETALETLDDRGITIRTWTNHGAATNVQCLGARDAWQGDLAGARGYHADLTVAHGVRWIWTGLELADRIALDARRPRKRGPAPLVAPHTLRDGQRVARFQRYSGIGPSTPVLGDVPAQLSRGNLDELVASGGYAIVYQHLAVRRLRSGFGPGAYGPVAPQWFEPAELSALRELARRHHAGEIWVAPTTTLLRYHEVHRRVSWTARSEPGRDVILLHCDRRGPADLAGLTFSCARPEQTRVHLETEDGAQPIDEVRPNPADETGRPSITIYPPGTAPALP